MPTPERDLLAQQAAGLFVAGKAATVAEAIRLVMGASDAPAREAPSHGRVRKHIRGMTMQAMGEPAYRASVRAVLETAEQIMTVLEESPVGARTAFVGRAAEGKIDGDFRVHIRVYTRAAVSAIADVIEGEGFSPPEIETINTRHGKVNRLTFDDDDVTCVLTRCPPDMKIPPDRDLMEGRKIESLTLEELRRRIDGWSEL